MGGRNLRRVRFVLVAALLLLGVTAGSATAGALITGARIKDGTVAGVDVRDQNLTGADIGDGKLTINDVGGLAPGPKGDAGAPGYPGADGVPGLVQRSAPRTLEPGEQLSWVVFCNTGEAAVSGGVSSERPDLVTVVRSFADGFFWSVEVLNDSTTQVRVHGWAMCIPV